MFIKEDLYTVTGTTKLYHCWTDKVTKFDSSSFYNWEQDNMPIYDLDERTHYLWEQLGYPTSSIPGVSLVVSADAPDNQIDCNKNIFRTVSAAVAALPKVINYPIVIEVANFGELGDLILDGLVFGKNGSIEIINRNFARSTGSLSGTTALSLLLPPLTSWNSKSGGNNKYDYVSSLIADPGSEAYDSSTARFLPLNSFNEASCISISAAVFSSTYDARLSGVGGLSPKLNGYCSFVKSQNNYARSTLIIDTANTTNPYDKVNSKLVWEPFDLNSAAISENEMTTKDASTTSDFTSQHLYLSNGYIAENLGNIPKTYLATNGLFYGNKLNKITINNCKGKIYIRNFFLDGSGYYKTDNINGVEINNSTVTLENIISTRYRKAGFSFKNSDITITRACVASRIYDFNLNNQRVTGDISSIRDYYSFDQASGTLNYDDAAGMKAENSTINFSSTADLEYSLYSAQLSATPIVPSWHVFEFVNNANGIILNNSVITGGKTNEYDKAFVDLYEHTFDIAHNVGNAIIMNNSKISLNGNLRIIENINGIKLNNSILETDDFAAIFNQNIAIEANSSQILYNKNFAKKFLPAAAGTTGEDAVSYKVYTRSHIFFNNGQNLNLNNSNFYPFMSSSIEDYYDGIDFRGSIRGKHIQGNALIENIKLNNSKATLISPWMIRSSDQALFGTNEVFKKGTEIYATNNSKVNLIGTKWYATQIGGPPQYTLSKNLAGVCADKNSSIEFNGPTVLYQYGIDAMADNNSTLSFCQRTLGDDGAFDLSTVNLADPLNHTAVELHATKACLVVNNNSQLKLKNLGSYRTCWAGRSGLTSLTDSSGIDTIYDYGNYETYTSGGSLQFYPNPIAIPNEDSYTTIKGSDNLSGANIVVNFLSSTLSNRGLYMLKNLANSQLSFSSVTHGGVCVKALNNSIVDVFNVNFPCGFWNPSAAYYDGTLALDSGGACYKTFIWNIADTSQLKASLLSVSGLYPSGAGYVGPYGFWASSTSAAAYGLPSSTPDTSSLSVLDYFGTNPSSTAYSVISATNYGPFRLYFSVNQLANALSNVSGDPGYGIIPQIYAQGYQPSGNLIASGITDPSSLYMQSWQRNSTTNIISPSGYYYGKDMVTNPYFQRVILDESAANVFANAKHCAVGKSNNARLVSIYYPYTEIEAGDSASRYGVGSLSVFDIERYS